MFSQRRSNQKLPIELYAQFRQSHGNDVASGTSPAIHLSPAEIICFQKSGRPESVGSGTERSEELSTATPGLSSLSSVSIVSPGNPASATSVGFMKDVFVLGDAPFNEDTMEEFYQSGHVPLDLSLSNSVPTWMGLFDPKQDVAVEESQKSFNYPASFITPALLDAHELDDMEIACEDENDIDYPDGSMDFSGDGDGDRDISQAGQPIKTRFCHILNAPPALRKEPGGNLVTYLNKGSQYTLLVKDTAVSSADTAKRRLYCTSVQVAFDTEAQRERPLASWQLWNQTRGTDEGHLHQGKFLAIEFVNMVPSDNSNQSVSKVQVVHSDGFSLVWDADCGSPRECSLTFQLNFLSTDFSHVKGIHGLSMQLCCKTEEISPESLQCPTSNTSVNYCRIQVFRSHGAERKMSNDLTTAGKRIARLEQQLYLSKTLSKDDKTRRHRRKTSSSVAPKRERGLGSIHEDVLRSRIHNIQKSCSSTATHSLLDLQSEQQRHCDWFPSLRDRTNQDLTPELGRAKGTVSTPYDNRIASTSQQGIEIQNMVASSPHSPPTGIDKSWHNTLPPINPMIRTIAINVARFYVRPLDTDTYAPIDLVSRSALELTAKVAIGVGVDPARVFRSIWLCDRGYSIIVDDDVVMNMKEGQGMRVAIKNIGPKYASGNPKDPVESQGRRDELCELVLEF